MDGRIIPDKELQKMSIREINAHYRLHDESYLFPICGRFNATERAIRRLRKARHDGLVVDSPLEYMLALENELSRIINNW